VALPFARPAFRVSLISSSRESGGVLDRLREQVHDVLEDLRPGPLLPVLQDLLHVDDLVVQDLAPKQVRVDALLQPLAQHGVGDVAPPLGEHLDHPRLRLGGASVPRPAADGVQQVQGPEVDLLVGPAGEEAGHRRVLDRRLTTEEVPDQRAEVQLVGAGAVEGQQAQLGAQRLAQVGVQRHQRRPEQVPGGQLLGPLEPLGDHAVGQHADQARLLQLGRDALGGLPGVVGAALPAVDDRVVLRLPDGRA